MRLACFGLLALFAATAHAEDKLLACVEDADYPPFTYFERTGDKQIPKGSTPAMVERLSRQIGVPIEIVVTSMKRCLNGVERGSFDIGMDFYRDAERNRKYDYSSPYLSLQPHYYFDKTRFPDGLEVRSRADLKRYRGCGVYSYSYEHFDLSEGPAFDTSSRSQTNAVRMLFAGRCDYFPAEREVIEGYRLVGGAELADNPRLGLAPVADAPAPQLHFLYSKHSPRVQKLRPAIDAFLLTQRKAVGGK
jgi:polar amino acid transport system substrate-binding protein